MPLPQELFLTSHPGSLLKLLIRDNHPVIPSHIHKRKSGNSRRYYLNLLYKSGSVKNYLVFIVLNPLKPCFFWGLQIKRALTSFLKYNEFTTNHYLERNNAHEHYTILTFYYSISLSAKLLADKLYLQIYPPQAMGFWWFSFSKLSEI